VKLQFPPTRSATPPGQAAAPEQNVHSPRRPDLFIVIAGAMFLGGAALRLWLLVGAGPGFVGYPDSRDYILAAATSIFESELHPAGYPLFLRAAHAVTAHLSFTIALQHALGIAMAGLYMASVARMARRRWVALIPAIVVLFDGLQLFFEHAVMPELLLMALIAGAMYSGVRSLSGRPVLWASLMGLSVGIAVTVRVVALPLVVVVALWLALTNRRGARPLLPAVAATAVALTIVGGYIVDSHAQTGTWGLTRADGLNLYLRVAGFAHCSGWRPPPGTSVLCARRAPPRALDKPGPFLWACGPAPGLCQFGNPPDASARLRRFAVAAIENQPLDYLAATGRDLLRFALPPHRGTQTDLIKLVDDPAAQAASLPEVSSYYANRSVSRSRALERYARDVHTGGLGLALFVAVALIALVLCRGRERAAAALFASTGLTLLVAAVATVTYEPRYGLPAVAPLAAAGALAVSALATRQWRGAKPAQRAGAPPPRTTISR
jgi:hypothetical protein